MQTRRLANGDSALPRGGVLTIGNFDGIHLGQLALVERVVAKSRQLGAPAVVLTFDPHPLAILAPERAPRRLTTDAQRARLLSAAGLDVLLVVPFTAELAEQTAESFVRRTLVASLRVREVHVGQRFAFGRGRAGDLALLERLGGELGFRAFGVPEVELDGEPVSATRVRRALEAGEVELAERLLGRPYALAGWVAHGDGTGRRLGFPTLNLDPEGELLPRDGVYVSAVWFAATGELLPGVTNVGIRPTLHGGDPRRIVEAHLFDFDRDVYGAEVEVRFHARLRGELRFPSADALREQIARDAGAAREYFRSAGRFQTRGAPAPGTP